MRAVPKHIYPFASNFLELDKGLRYHYLDEGSGPPVVMVHGNPTWSLYYRQLVTLLRDRYRCIVPDHIGCGLSDKPDDSRYEYSLAQRADDLARLIDTLGLKKVHLVMHDWGGMIGMTWASRHPAQVDKVVLLNTAAFHLPPSKPLPPALGLARNSRLGAFLVRRFNAFSRAAASVACTRNPMSRELKDAYTAPYDSWQNRIATLRFVQDIPLKPGDRGYEIVSEVAASIPSFNDRDVFIGWGLKDFVFDAHFLREWERLLPNATIHRYDDAGHYILEDAWDDLKPLLDGFFTDAPAASS